jgi:hypothetical protein
VIDGRQRGAFALGDVRLPLTITLVLVALFSVVVGRILHRYTADRWPLSGVEYLVVGVLAGPYGLALLDDHVIDAFQPMISLTLGVVGFSLGLALRMRVRRVGALAAGFVSAIMTIVLIALVSDVLMRARPLIGGRDPFWVALSLGSAAAAVSMQVVDGSAKAFGARGFATDVVRSYALAGSITAVCISGTGLALGRAYDASNRFTLSEAQWLLASAGLGVACGLLFVFFMGRRRDEADDRLFLATVGILTFTSGLAAAAGMSPLLLCMVAGLIVSLASKDAQSLHDKLERLERPAIVALMVLAGAMWRPVSGLGWLLPVGYVAARLVALRLTATVSAGAFPHLPPVHRLGTALLAQGSVAVALAVNHAQVDPLDGPPVLTTVLLAALIFDPLAPALLRRFLVDAGDVDRVDEAPPPLSEPAPSAPAPTPEAPA